MPRIKRGSVGMPKSRKKKAEPAQVSAGDASSSAAPQTTAAPAEAAAQGSSEPCAPSSEDDAPVAKKQRVVMYVEPGEVAVVRKKIVQPPAPSGALMQRVRDRQLEEQRYHAALCDNSWCDCTNRGVALLGQHDMFCQLHKCYAA